MGGRQERGRGRETEEKESSAWHISVYKRKGERKKSLRGRSEVCGDDDHHDEAVKKK